MPGQPWLSVPGRWVSASELKGKGPNIFSSDVMASAARAASCVRPTAGFASAPLLGIDAATSGGMGDCEVGTISIRGGFAKSFSTPRVAYESTVTVPAVAVLRKYRP